MPQSQTPQAVDGFGSVGRSALKVSMIYTSACLQYKVAVANDVDMSLAEDPMELWLAMGLSLLLLWVAIRKGS